MKQKIRSRLLGLAFTLALSSLVAACGGVNMLSINAKSGTVERTISNGSLQSDAEIITGKAAYSEQLMQAVVDIQSHTGSTQKLYYRFVWYDSDGFQQAETPWMFLALNATEHKQVSGTAPSPKAEKVEFTLRRRSTEDHEN